MGYHSLLAFWVGGAGRLPPPPGYRSSFGFWLGGVGLSPPAPALAGYRSPFAFWLGNVGFIPGEEPPEPEPGVIGGGGFRLPVPRRARKLNDDEELIAIITAAIHAGLLQ